MTDLLKDILYGIIHGFRDSILGTVKIFKLDNQDEEEESDRSTEPMTTLARRRAEKRKDKSSSQKQQKYGFPNDFYSLFLCCAVTMYFPRFSIRLSAHKHVLFLNNPILFKSSFIC